MTMPLPGMQPQITTPPVRKAIVQCCGYSALLGTPHQWECPACHRVHDPERGG